MNSLKFKNPNRKRKNQISYKDPLFTWGYDLDIKDFTDIVEKHNKKEDLTISEDDRLGKYILTVIEIVLENKKFKNKNYIEKYELRDQMYYEIICGLHYFDKNKGSTIYSYLYRIGYTAACHYYTEKEKEEKHNNAIVDKVQELYDSYEYLYGSSGGKVNTYYN